VIKKSRYSIQGRDRYGGETPGLLQGVVYGIQFVAVDKNGKEKIIMEKQVQ